MAAKNLVLNLKCFIAQICLTWTIVFQTVQSNFIINLLKFCDLSKAGGKDNLSGRFLKDGADVLVIEIT